MLRAAALFAILPILIAASALADSPRARARDLGVAPGIFAPGPHNAITDVDGVRVGQSTLHEGDGVRTGITAILPHAGNLYRERVPAALHVGNGFGKLLGVTQLTELGELETPVGDEPTLTISRDAYADRLEGFWLGQSIANWTGLVTEMDKIGNLGDLRTGPFYTDRDWGEPDQPSIWSTAPSELSPTIDFVFRDPGELWGADDDTDIEYIYQHLLLQHGTSMLTPEQIRDGWLTHIYNEDEPTPFGPDEDHYQNFLWVSNQAAYDLMLEGVLPPATSDPARNPHWAMIDAQLTTEIFGLFAPGRPDIALRMAALPIRTVARGEAALAAEFYVIMHALSAAVDPSLDRESQVRWLAARARAHLPDGSYTAAMYDYVASAHAGGMRWEQARDGLYQRYQVEGKDGYDVTRQNLYCNGCFASGINFGASLISLFWGAGDLAETIRIAALVGWDSDNPAATWGGLLGSMLGRRGIEAAFDRRFSERFHIHRTRRGFEDDGVDSFPRMAERGLQVVDRVVREEARGAAGVECNCWIIPLSIPQGTGARDQ